MRAFVDEPRRPGPFTGTAEPHRSCCGKHENRRGHAEPPAAQHFGRGDRVAAPGAAERVGYRAVPSTADVVPAALPAHVAVAHSAVPAGVAETAGHCKLRRQTSAATGGNVFFPLYNGTLIRANAIQ